MVSLFNLFENSVDASIVAKSSISILATAGMRLLPYQNKIDIIEKLKLELPKRVKTKIIKIKIISGRMEGVYEWVANNYLQGKMNKQKQITKTKGIIELGGASLQIVYERHKNNYYNKIFNFYNYTMNQNIKYKLHSESLLGYGFQSVYHWFFSSENIFITDKQKYIYKHIKYYRLNCLPKNYKSRFIKDKTLQNNGVNFGTGDFKNCINHVETAFVLSKKVVKLNNKLYFPNINLQSVKNQSYFNTNTMLLKMHPKLEFDAFSEFYYASNDFFKYNFPFNSDYIDLYIDQVYVVLIFNLYFL